MQYWLTPVWRSPFRLTNKYIPYRTIRQQYGLPLLFISLKLYNLAAISVTASGGDICHNLWQSSSLAWNKSNTDILFKLKLTLIRCSYWYSVHMCFLNRFACSQAWEWSRHWLRTETRPSTCSWRHRASCRLGTRLHNTDNMLQD